MDNINNIEYPMPYNLEAEQSVLGSILVDSTCLPVVMEQLKAESFYRQQHKEIFSVMLQMFINGENIDYVTVLDEVNKLSVFKSPEDAKVYLYQLTQIVPTVANVENYAKIVKEKSYIRNLIEATLQITDLARSSEADADELLEIAEQKIYDIRKGKDTNGLVRIDEIITETYDRFQRLTSEEKDEYMGLSTGYSALDQVISGLNKSDLLLIAARPAMGKSSFALNLATNVALKSQKTVAFFSLEMSNEQLISKILSCESSVSSKNLQTGDIQASDWIKLGLAAQKLSKAPMYFDDTAGITVSQIKAKLRRVKNLGLVVIDYLQLISSGKRNENRVQEVSEITRNLKIMAKELNVPVVTLSQLSRGPEARSDHRPMLADLRESGSIEQDADIVMFIYRDAYYNPDSNDVNVAEIIVAKNRHGQTDTVKLVWDGEYSRFSSLEKYRDEQ